MNTKTDSHEIEGPYSFKGANGLKTPVYIFQPGGEKKIIGEATVTVDGGMTFDVQLEEEYKDIETGGFEVPMRYTFFNRSAQPKINWAFNCLTQGVHHGRPEAIWNIPVRYAAQSLYSADTLKELVISRIYNDAMQFVERDQEFLEQGARETPSYTEEWALKVKETAEELYADRLGRLIPALDAYYKSPSFARDAQDVARLNTKNKLNTHYAPLHGHDSINLLCRMVGVEAFGQVAMATRETE